jgi:MFS family permease
VFLNLLLVFNSERGFKMKKKLEQNIYKDYIFSFSTNLNLTQGVWMLYLAYRGLTLFEIGIMESIYHITAFSMEVPTGIIADIYGRKTSRVIGRLFSIIAIITMLLSNNIYLFALSFIFTALGNNLESGAGEALIYDSLKELGKENQYMKITGKKEVFFQSASSIALVIGGYLATIDYFLVYKFALIITIITFIQTFSFTEPNYGKIIKEKNTFSTLIKQLKTSVRILKNDRKIYFLIIILGVFSVYFATEFFYVQNLLKMTGSTEFQIGLILASGSVGGALMAMIVHKLDDIYTPDQLLVFFPILAIIGFWLMTITSIIWIAFIFLCIVEGALFILIGDYINRLIPSEQRATIISFQSMLYSILMIILFPAVGKIGDIYNLHIAFIIIAVFATVTLGSLVWILKSKSRKFKQL